MRIRFKKWARPELLQSNFFIDNPQDYKNKWKTAFKNKEKPLYLELGCGKGSFVSQIAIENLNKNFIAIDMIDSMLGVARRTIQEKYDEAKIEVDNIKLARFDIMQINNYFGEKDKIERIYINFCNPWPRGKHHKKRLTHLKQLELYKNFLVNDGEIYFKTDDDGLFESSVNYFKESGFEITKITYDLDKEENFWTNYETEHEKSEKIRDALSPSSSTHNNRDWGILLFHEKFHNL